MSQPEASSTGGATPSISEQPDSIGNSQPEGASTGPRTPEGKRRSARNASKHQILVDRILPEEVKVAAVLREEFLEELEAKGLLEREIVEDLVINRLQKRRIDRHGVNSILKERENCFEALVETEEQRQAEQWLRYADTRGANSAGWKRLIPEACLDILGALRVTVQERGPSPEEDLHVLRRVYGREPTLLGARILFLYQVLRSSGDQRDELDEQSIVEPNPNKVREEIQRQQDRIERKSSIIKLTSSVNITMPSAIEDAIQRYRAANAREFTHLLDDLERVRRLGKHT